MEVIHQTDRELLRAWLNGQEAAFGKLVERHAGLVFSVAVRQTGDRTAAEEVAQDVFAVLARKARALLHHPSVPAWLHTTSRNIARRERAKLSSHHRKLERLGEELRTKGRSENSLPDDARIDGAISKLPVNEREVILLRFFEDRDYSEIAVRLSINEAAARKRCSRGLQRLEKALQQRLGEGAHLASMAIPVPATLVAAVVSSTGKASASATATGAAGALATTFGMITMNTLAKTTIGTIAGAGLAWFGVSNYTARKDLKNELKNVRASYTTVSLKDKAASAAANDYDTEILNLKGQLSDTTAERDELRSQLASLNEAVGDLSQDVVVNLGRIQDLGGNYAKLMVDAQGLVARFSNSDESISPQERQKMMKEFLEGASDITAAVPEIIGFEERPKDMSRFLQSLFQELAGIDETKAATLNPLLEKIYTEAIENEFTMKHAPQLDADQFDAWKAERDAFFAIGRAEILESLPVGNRELFEERIDDDSLWPRDLNVGRLPVVFNPAGDTAAKVYRQMEKLTRAREVAPQE